VPVLLAMIDALTFANRLYLAHRAEFENGGAIPSPQSARQIAGPSIADAKDSVAAESPVIGCISGAKPGVSRVAQRPAAQADTRETASVTGSTPDVLPAKGT
jgi:hypothetical protein